MKYFLLKFVNFLCHNLLRIDVYNIGIMTKYHKYLTTSLIIAFFSVFLLANSTQAASTYYVDANDPQAADSNDGTFSSPWKTISKAASVVGAGDTVLVRPGTYNERISLARAGSSGGKITFRSEEKWQAKTFGFELDAPYNRVEGFDISSRSKNYADGSGISINADNSEVTDNYVHDSYAGITRFGKVEAWVSNVYVGGNVIRRPGTFGIVASGNNWLVENNEVDHLIDGDSSQDSDFSRFFGDNITFRGNYFHGAKLSELGAAHVDCFQTYDNNGEFATNITIEENRCLGAFNEGIMAESGYSRTQSGNWLINDNVFANGSSWGINLHGIANVVVINNVFADIAANGVGFRSAKSGAPYSNRETTGIISNNTFYNTGSWEGATYFSDGDSVITEAMNNLVYRDVTVPESFFDRQDNPDQGEPEDLASGASHDDPSDSSSDDWQNNSEDDNLDSDQDEASGSSSDDGSTSVDPTPLPNGPDTDQNVSPQPSMTPIPVPVEESEDDESPIVAWIDLSADQVLSGTVSLPLKARDNVGIDSIQLYATRNPVGEVATGAPYNLVWDTTTVSNGEYKLQAIAKDDAGNIRRTAEVWVTIRN